MDITQLKEQINRWLRIFKVVAIVSAILFIGFEVIRPFLPFLLGIYVEDPIRGSGEIARYVTAIAWSKDGKSLYYARNEIDDKQTPEIVYRYDLQKRKSIRIGEYDGFVDISPDEREILLATDNNSNIAIINIATGTRREILLPEKPDGPFPMEDLGIYWTQAGIVYFTGLANKIDNVYYRRMHCLNPITLKIKSIKFPAITEKQYYSRLFSRNDGLAVGYSVSETKFVIYDVLTFKKITTLDISFNAADTTQFFSKENIIFRAQDYVLVDILTGKQEALSLNLPGDNPTYIKFSPDLIHIAGVCHGGGDLYNKIPRILYISKM